MIVYGSYNFFRRRLAYRRDWCLSCEKQVVAERMRSVDFLHLFWIPVFPLGVWKRWLCMECGSSPRERVQTGKAVKLVGAFLLLVFAIVCWAEPVKAGEAAVSWAFRILVPLGLIATLYSAFKSDPPPDIQDKLKALDPFPDDNCLFCEVQLVRDPDHRCPKCAVVRE